MTAHGRWQGRYGEGMAFRGSYGEQLREARVRRGMDIHSVSRRLRIRLDILTAIEEANFAQLPPSGYTRNMITAYARLVGLDPLEVSEAYLDELYRFETGRGSDPMPSARRGASRRSSAVAPAGRPLGAGSRAASTRGEGSIYDRNGTQRIRYNAYEDYISRPLPPRDDEPAPARSGRPARTQRGQRSQRARQDARSASLYDRDLAPQRGRSARQSTSIGQYAPSTFARPSGSGGVGAGIMGAILPRLPIILVALVVIVLVIVVISLAFGGERQGADDVPSVPISGLTDTSGQSDDAYSVATAVAPTSAVLTVEVAEGERSWISVYLNGSEDPEYSQVMEAGQQSFTFTQSIRVVAGNPTPVTLKVDGETVQLEKTSSGSYAYSAEFSDILDAWNEKHGTKSSSSRSAASSSSSSGSSSSSSASSS